MLADAGNLFVHRPPGEGEAGGVDALEQVEHPARFFLSHAWGAWAGTTNKGRFPSYLPMPPRVFLFEA